MPRSFTRLFSRSDEQPLLRLFQNLDEVTFESNNQDARRNSFRVTLSAAKVSAGVSGKGAAGIDTPSTGVHSASDSKKFRPVLFPREFVLDGAARSEPGECADELSHFLFASPLVFRILVIAQLWQKIRNTITTRARSR